jgi:hypothetical protein
VRKVIKCDANKTNTLSVIAMIFYWQFFMVETNCNSQYKKYPDLTFNGV